LPCLGFGEGAPASRPPDWIAAMTPDLQRIEWMPSPPLVPEDGPISLDLLRRVTLGDTMLEREVLGMFSSQAVRLLERLQVLPEDFEQRLVWRERSGCRLAVHRHPHEHGHN